MKLTGMFSLACGAALAAAVTGATAAAQEPAGGVRPAAPTKAAGDKAPAPAAGIKPAIETQPGPNQAGAPKTVPDDGSYRFTNGDDTLTHGQRVTIRRKNGNPVVGTFVYADPKTGRIYVRTAPGQAPVAVATKEIDRINDITPAVGTTGKSGVRPAIEDVRPVTGAPGGSGTGEVYSMTVYDGPFKRVFFYDTAVLSPGERDQLGALEKAGNDVTQKAVQVELLRKAIEDASAPPATAVVAAGPYAAPFYPVVPYPFVYPVNYGIYSPLLPGLNFGGNNIYYYGGLPTTFYPTYGGGSTTVVMQGGENGRSIAALSKSLTEAQAALAQAQKSYAALGHRAVYDNNGRIVAVRLED